MNLRAWLHADGWRLSTRMAVMSLLLLLIVQSFSFGAIRVGIEDNARTQLRERLEVGQRVWARLIEQRATKLSQGAAVLAADFGFRDAVGTNDRETIADALGNHGARIGAAMAALMDPAMGLRAMSRGGSHSLLSAITAHGPQLADKGAAIALVDHKPYQLVMVPMNAPVLVGWVVMAFELDEVLVKDLYKITGLHGTLVALPAGEAPALLQTSLPEGTSTGPLLRAREEVDIDGDDSLVRSVAVSAMAGSTVQLRLTGSIGAAVRPYEMLQITLAALTVVGLLLFGAGSVWTARLVTQPLQSLVKASNRLGQGEYDVPVEHTQREDEIGELAKAFEHMRVNIAEHEQEIRLLAYWDRLTGLPNRVQFRDVVLAAIARSNPAQHNLAVIMLDLDRFKHVNDVLGYASGDLLLQGVAQRLKHVVRGVDTLARLGGDEFALLLPDADAALAMSVAERITKAFEQPLELTDQMVDLSAGLGIACWPSHARETDALLSRAEVAMYAAKQRTAGAQLYDPALDSASAQTLSLLSELRQAVERNELRLFLQPKIAVATGALCGAEALVRWQHPQRGLVPPMEFIPFAEQTGFIRQLTLWMFEQTARQQFDLAEYGIFRVSVNLSTRDLMDLDLPAKLDAILQRHRARAEGFCLEITESAIMDDPQRAEGTLNRLSQRGFKLSIDDFGTGYSSLAYLKRLPVNELKIDKSFVMGMERGNDDAKIVRSTIDLAHNLGLSVVAEGVENAAILQRLHVLGCEEAQGYHLSKPLPLRDFMVWAGQWQATPPTASLTGDETVLQALH
jgi:diguanylate cyclase (GGDEF)-like protein